MKDIICDIYLSLYENPTPETQYWAEISSKRFSLTIDKILEYSENKQSIKILNASGFGSWDHDLTIVTYLKSIEFPFEWYVYDSPNNPYLEDSNLKEKIDNLDININYLDLNNVKEWFDNNQYDIILFTEIVEHLDHSTLLKTLNFLNSRLENDWKLIITTPSSFWFPSRVANLFWKEWSEFYGEWNLNLEKWVYWHITYFNPIRLQRIVEDCWFNTLELFTFDWIPAWDNNGILSTIYEFIINIITSIVKNSKWSIFLSITKDNSKKWNIPFEV